MMFRFDIKYIYERDGSGPLRIISDPPFQVSEGNPDAVAIIQPQTTEIVDDPLSPNQFVDTVYVIPIPSEPGVQSAVLEVRTNSANQLVDNIFIDFDVDPFFTMKNKARFHGMYRITELQEDPGTSDSDRITNDNTPSFFFDSEFMTIGTEIELLVEGQSLGLDARTSEADTILTWDVPTTAPLADGTYQVVQRVTEPFNGSTKDFPVGIFEPGPEENPELVFVPYLVVIDTVAPVATFESLAGPVVNALPDPLAISYTEPMFNLQASDFELLADGTPVSISSLSVDGDGNLVGLAALVEDGREYELRLASGADAIDEAGNALQATPLQFTYDVSQPTVAFNPLSYGVVEQLPDPLSLATFSESVQNVDISDLVVTRDGSPVALTGASFDASGTLSGFASAVATPGLYELSFAPSTDIVDPASNPLTLPAQPLVFRVVDDGLAETGDLNGDGVPDAQQALVASGLDANGDPFFVQVTDVSTTDTLPWLENVSVLNPGDAALPGDTSLPEGALSFSINGLSTSTTSTVTLRLNLQTTASQPYLNILKLGDGAPRVLAGEFTVIDANTYEIVLTDNGPDDLNPALGVIEDPSAPSSTGPLPAYITAFEGSVDQSGNVTLEWATTSETDLATFDIVEALEDAVSDWAAGATLTASPIAATGGVAAGADYDFTDPTQLNFGETRHYFLVEEQLSGQRNSYGPISVTNNNTSVVDWMVWD